MRMHQEPGDFFRNGADSTYDPLHTQLSFRERLLLNSELERRAKSQTVFFLLLAVGHMGIHRFYLREPVGGAIQLALTVTAGLFYVLGSIFVEPSSSVGSVVGVLLLVLAALIFLGVLIWVIVDISWGLKRLREMNLRVERELVSEILSLRSRSSQPSN